jgi:hypothetical protein
MNKKAFALVFCSLMLVPAVCRAEATEVIAIVGAMEEETEPFLTVMNVTKSYTVENAMAWEGRLSGKDVVLAQCGIGQKNAEKCTSFLLDNYPAEALIFCGVGGSTKLGIGTDEVVISSEIMSLNPFETCETDVELASIALNNSFDFDVHYGRFYTATPLMLDEFILYPYLWIRGVKCAEMENLPMAEIAASQILLTCGDFQHRCISGDLQLYKSASWSYADAAMDGTYSYCTDL